MNKKKVILISAVVLVILIISILLAILIARSRNMDIFQNPTSAPVSSSTSINQLPVSYTTSNSSNFSLLLPDLGTGIKRYINLTATVLPEDTIIKTSDRSVLLSNSKFSIVILTSLGENGGIIPQIENKVPISNESISNIDRFKIANPAFTPTIETLIGNSFSNYYFYSNLSNAQCIDPAAYCGVMEVKLNTQSQFGFDTYITIYCNSNDANVSNCDEVVSNLNLNLRGNLTYYFDPQDIQKTALYSKNNDSGEVLKVLDLDPNQGKGIQSVSPSGKYIIIGRGAQYVGGLRLNIYDLDTKELVANLIPTQMFSTWISSSTLVFVDTLSSCDPVNITGEQYNCERTELAISKYNFNTNQKEILFHYQKKADITGNIEELLNDNHGKVLIKIVEDQLVNGQDQILAHLSYSYDILSGEFTHIN